MNIREIEAKSILIKRKKIDSWFISSYNMNLYRGCSHNCSYCDGRSEGYYLKGEFGKDIEVKINAIEILEKELDPSRKRKPMSEGFILVGGGICDTYEPVELKYELTRKSLELFKYYKKPVHILTKSTNVERDLDLLIELNKISKVIVSFSFSTVNDEIAKHFEPGAPSPSKRLGMIKKLKSFGIRSGMFLMPVIPFISDKPKNFMEAFTSANSINADYIVFGGMTMKQGNQQEYFLNKLAEYDESLLIEYSTIFRGDRWGNAVSDYYDYINQLFLQVSKKFKIPKRIPNYIYKPILSQNKYISVLLDQLDYLVKLNYGKSNFRQASNAIYDYAKPISEIRTKLKTLNGIGSESEKLVKEILNNGSCTYYENLL